MTMDLVDGNDKYDACVKFGRRLLSFLLIDMTDSIVR